MDAMKSMNIMQLQAKSLGNSTDNPLSTQSIHQGNTKDLNGKNSKDSEFDLELIQAGLASQQLVAQTPVQQTHQEIDPSFGSELERVSVSEGGGVVTAQAAQKNGLETTQLGQDPLGQRLSVSAPSTVPTLASNSPTFSQNTEKASTGPAQIQTREGKSRAQAEAEAGEPQSSIGTPTDRSQELKFPALDTRFLSTNRSKEVGGRVITGQESGMSLGSRIDLISSGARMRGVEIGSKLNKEMVLPMEGSMSGLDLNSVSSELSLAPELEQQDEWKTIPFNSKNSQPVQEENIRKQLVSGNDFMNTRGALISSQNDPSLLSRSDWSAQLNQGGGSQSQGLAGGFNPSRGLIKDKPRLVSGQREMLPQIQDIKASSAQNPGDVITQKQALPLVLVRDRLKDKFGREEELNTSSNLDSKSQVQVPSQLFGAAESASKSGPKSEIIAQVSTQDPLKGGLTSEGLSNLGLGILRTSYQGGGEIRVRLRPDHLGELNIRVLTEGNRVGLKIQASDDRAKKILEESIGSLKENLSSQNLNLGVVDLSVAKNEGSQDSRPFQNSTGFQNESGQSRNQNNSQSERFYEEARAPRQNLEGETFRSSRTSMSSSRGSMGSSRLDVMV